MKNNFSLEDKVIVISGASSGIGRATAIECAKHGAKLLLIARNQAGLAETAAQFPDSTGFETLNYDLSQNDDLKEKIAEKIKVLGKIDGLVHAAGLASLIPLRMLKSSQLQEEMNINVFAGIELMKLCSNRQLVSPQGASFVMISSAIATNGEPGRISYAATKAALQGMVRSAAAELADKKIRVNTISPGYICDTGITRHEFETMTPEAQLKIASKHPLGLGQVQFIAEPIVFLLSDAAQWITGTNLIVDGGFSL